MEPEILTGVVSLLVAIIGAVSGLFALAANRSKTASEASENDATAAEIITRAAGDAVQLAIKAAEANCRELIRQAVEESEARCNQQLDALRAWGEKQAAEACESRAAFAQKLDFLTARLAERDELLAAREDEIAQMVAESEQRH